MTDLSSDYKPTPALIATDLVLIRDDGKILFIRRKNEPFAGKLALPGGFVEPGQTIAQAAIRELKQETGVEVDQDDLICLGYFDAPDRDPRGRVISIAFGINDLDEATQAVAGDDAAEAVWLEPDEARKIGLAFDHAEILTVAEEDLDV